MSPTEDCLVFELKATSDQSHYFQTPKKSNGGQSKRSEFYKNRINSIGCACESQNVCVGIVFVSQIMVFAFQNADFGLFELR